MRERKFICKLNAREKWQCYYGTDGYISILNKHYKCDVNDIMNDFKLIFFSHLVFIHSVYTLHNFDVV